MGGRNCDAEAGWKVLVWFWVGWVDVGGSACFGKRALSIWRKRCLIGLLAYDKVDTVQAEGLSMQVILFALPRSVDDGNKSTASQSHAGHLSKVQCRRRMANTMLLRFREGGN